MEDTFALYELKVEVLASEKTMVCGHHAGDYFLVEGENLVFPQTRSFSLYALAALLPLIIAMVKRPALYNGIRHFVFVVPPMAILGGIVVGVFAQIALRTGFGNGRDDGRTLDGLEAVQLFLELFSAALGNWNGGHSCHSP